MSQTNLAFEPHITSGIEWTLDQKFHFGFEQAEYLKDKIALEHFLPIRGATIPFDSNVWDFNDCFYYRSSNELRFSFENIPSGYIISAKYFVLMTLLNGNIKIMTIARKYADLRRFFRAMARNGITAPSQLVTNDFKNYIDEYINSHTTQTSCIAIKSLQMYATYLVVNYEYRHNIDLSIFNSYNWLIRDARIAREAKKTPNIPDDYYDKLLSVLINVMNDHNIQYKYRAVACLYIIMSQTGLRLTELNVLTLESLQKISFKNIDNAYYLQIREFKSASKQQEYTTFKIFANEIVVKAFKTLANLSKKRMKEKHVDFIYLPDCNYIPAPASVTVDRFKQLMVLYAPFAIVDQKNNFNYKGVSIVKYHDKYIAVPTSKQFRVHVCSELYYTHHVSLLFIQKCMGHLSSEMQGYYVRSKSKASEEAEAKEKILKDIVQKKVTLLGGKCRDITEQINKFIDEGKFNIEKNIDDLISYLEGKVAIRVKKNGFCIKATEYRECSRDEKTNEIYCAFDICPNLYHVYYMASDSYRDFKILQQTFSENVKNGFDLQASKELNKLKTICRKRLIPEMEDLLDKINLYGLSSILMEYPQLDYVVSNYESIMQEVNSWIKKSF